MEHVTFVSLFPHTIRHPHIRVSPQTFFLRCCSFTDGTPPDICLVRELLLRFIPLLNIGGCYFFRRFFRGAHFLGKHWCGFFPQGNWLLDVLSFFGGHSLRSTLWGPLFRVTLHAPLGGCGFSFLRTSIEVHPPLGYGGCLFFPVNTCCSFFTRTFVKFQVHGNVGGCPFFR